MLILAGAILTASAMGSMHCVGMCGPLAIWASGAAEPHTKRRVALAAFLYHLGRLTTYLMIGVVAGLVGELVDLSGEAIGVQVAAARVVGVLMVLGGLYRIWQHCQSNGAPKELQPSRVGGLLVKLRPSIFRLRLPMRGFATGVLTTFLPCGWLYLFAFVAAGTGSIMLAPLVMGAFWLGSVPALVGLVAGTGLFAKRFRLATPIVAALLLVTAGCYTASGRGFDSLESFVGLAQAAMAEPEQLGEAPLPCCCQPGESTCDANLDTNGR